jgi:polyisoprenoid-binding protein YceI
MTIETWAIDTSHSAVRFSVRHLVISRVHGRFARWRGLLEIDEARPERSRVEAVIQAASIDTGEEQRDAHLRSADFLDVERHPEIVFRSTRVEPAGADRWRLTGDLSIHGVSRPVTLDVERLGRTRDPWGGERVGFTGMTAIDRKDFGLAWNQVLETGGLLVGDRIEIGIDVEAVRQASAGATAAAGAGA